MKRKFSQWWSAFLPLTATQTITSDLKSLNIKNTTTYDIYKDFFCGKSCSCRLTVTRRVSLVEHELLTFSDELTPIFSGVHISRSLVFCVVFMDHCLSFYPFSIDRCIVRHLFLLTVVLYDIFFYWPLYCTTSFSIDRCIVRHLFLLTVVLYDIWLLLWYLQTFLNKMQCNGRSDRSGEQV
jgi:hypothetical protein